jgi:dTDP-glucose pyrophosphorylase
MTIKLKNHKMKIVILAAGRGKRMKEWTQDTTKSMLYIRSDSSQTKPMLQVTIEQFIQSGFKEFIIVVGYRKNDIKDHFGDGSFLGADIKYVTQHNICAGTADAVRCSNFFFEGYENVQKCSPFFLVYGDVVPDISDINSLITKYNSSEGELSSGSCGIMGVRRVDDPQRFGVVELNSNKGCEDQIIRIVEKSMDPPTNLINAGIYILPFEIFKHIRNTSLSQRCEFELTDSIQLMIDSGVPVLCQSVNDNLKDFGTKEIYETNK